LTSFSFGKKVTTKLTVATPSAKLVDAYLREIAKGYKLDWTPDDDESGDGGLKVLSPIDYTSSPSDI
jgi:vacuolar protein sorting-associated protein IST1